jgi:hypothetical protein
VKKDNRPEIIHIMSSQRTTSVVKWSEFLLTDPELRVRFPALPDFLRNMERGPISLVRIIEALFPV